MTEKEIENDINHIAGQFKGMKDNLRTYTLTMATQMHEVYSESVIEAKFILKRINKLEDLNLNDFANARKIMDQDPSLFSELEKYMNSEEKNIHTSIQNQAEACKGRVINMEEARRIGKASEALYNKVLERIKAEKYKN